MLLAAAFNLPAQTPGNIIYSKDYYRMDTEGIQYYIDTDGKLTFESMVTELGSSCFYNNRRIKSVVINKNINRIGFEAFAWCLNLKTVYLESSDILVIQEPFGTNPAVENVVIASGVTKISANLFSGCSKLTEIDIPESVQMIENSAFSNCALKTVTLHEGLKSIAQDAFDGNPELAVLRIPESVTALAQIYNPEAMPSTVLEVVKGSAAEKAAKEWKQKVPALVYRTYGQASASAVAAAAAEENRQKKLFADALEAYRNAPKEYKADDLSKVKQYLDSYYLSNDRTFGAYIDSQGRIFIFYNAGISGLKDDFVFDRSAAAYFNSDGKIIIRFDQYNPYHDFYVSGNMLSVCDGWIYGDFFSGIAVHNCMKTEEKLSVRLPNIFDREKTKITIKSDRTRISVYDSANFYIDAFFDDDLNINNIRRRHDESLSVRWIAERDGKTVYDSGTYAPYVYTFSNMPSGTYRVYALVSDNHILSGDYTQSTNAITITVGSGISKDSGNTASPAQVSGSSKKSLYVFPAKSGTYPTILTGMKFTNRIDGICDEVFKVYTTDGAWVDVTKDAVWSVGDTKTPGKTELSVTYGSDYETRNITLYVTDDIDTFVSCWAPSKEELIFKENATYDADLIKIPDLLTKNNPTVVKGNREIKNADGLWISTTDRSQGLFITKGLIFAARSPGDEDSWYDAVSVFEVLHNNETSEIARIKDGYIYSVYSAKNSLIYDGATITRIADGTKMTYRKSDKRIAWKTGSSYKFNLYLNGGSYREGYKEVPYLKNTTLAQSLPDASDLVPPDPSLEFAGWVAERNRYNGREVYETAAGNLTSGSALWAMWTAAGKTGAKTDEKAGTKTETPYFSIRDDRKIEFSKGNLQYQASTGTWRFADNQYDMIAGGTTSIPESTSLEIRGYPHKRKNYAKGNVSVSDNRRISAYYSGWIDLFGWATSGYHAPADKLNVNFMPYSYATTADMRGRSGNEDYSNLYGYGPTWNKAPSLSITGDYANYDWGVFNKISNGGDAKWRVLSSAEWDYLWQRTVYGNQSYYYATVNGVAGLILLPDNWKAPEGISFVVYEYFTDEETDAMMEKDPQALYKLLNFSRAEWNKMEKAGAVFLPATGYRVEKKLFGVGTEGAYWTSNAMDGSQSGTFSFDIYNISANSFVWRYEGHPVRLVKDIE